MFPRNLRLARLLVERGADPNLRIPMDEMQRSSQSPMEYLVKFCKDAIESSDPKYNVDQSEYLCEVIGLHNEVGLNPIQLKEQLLELLGVFLAHGGDPNVISTFAHSTVYHTVMRNREPCLELVLRLCEAGGDLNLCNAHRTTPLMDLVTYAELDTAMDILTSILEINPNVCSLKKLNCCRHSALWRAMLSGSPRVAIELLNKGADPEPQAIVSQGSCYRSGKYPLSLAAEIPWVLSALYAPLVGNSTPYVHFGCVTNSPGEFMPEDVYGFNIDLFNKVMAYSIYPVIDSTEGIFFSELTTNLQLELKNLLKSQTQFTMEQLETVALKDVPLLLFGNLKAGLQQMCIRQIIRQVLGNPGKFCQIVQDVTKNEEKTDDKVECVTDHWFLVQELTPAFVECLVTEHLKLPSVFINRFKIEAARLQLGARIFNLETIQCFQACDGESDEGSIDASLESIPEEGREDEDDDSSWLSASSVYEIDFRAFEGWVSKIQMECCSSHSGSMEETTSSEEEEEDDAAEPAKTVAENEKQVPSFVEKTMSSETNSSSSGESIPHNICRDKYEQFNNEFVNNDISPGNITFIDDEVASE